MAFEFRTWPDRQAVTELAQAAKANELCLLTGSIVSSFDPTGLPDGSTLRASILRALQLHDISLNPDHSAVANLPEVIEQLYIELCGAGKVSAPMHNTKIAISHAVSDTHWEHWASTQSVKSRRSAIARLFLAVPHPSVVIDILNSGGIRKATVGNDIEQLILAYRAYALDDKHTEAIAVCRQCLKLLRLDGDEIGALECMRELAHQNRMLGGRRLVQARRAFKLVIESCKKTSPTTRSRFFKMGREELLCEASLGIVLVENQMTAYMPIGRRFVTRNRLKIIDEALQLQERVGGLDLLGNLLRHRALALTFLGRFQEAEVDLLRARRIFEGLGRIRTGVVNTLQGLSFLYISQFKLDQAEQVSLEAINLIPPEGALAGRAKHCRQLALIALYRGRIRESTIWLGQMRLTGSRLEGMWNRVLFGLPALPALFLISVQVAWGKIRKQLVKI